MVIKDFKLQPPKQEIRESRRVAIGSFHYAARRSLGCQDLLQPGMVLRFQQMSGKTNLAGLNFKGSERVAREVFEDGMIQIRIA